MYAKINFQQIIFLPTSANTETNSATKIPNLTDQYQHPISYNRRLILVSKDKSKLPLQPFTKSIWIDQQKNCGHIISRNRDLLLKTFCFVKFIGIENIGLKRV